MKNCLLLIIIFFSLNIKAQDPREEIKLKSSDFKQIMKEKYNINITLVSFVVAVPVLFVIFVYILLALALMSGAEFKD